MSSAPPPDSVLTRRTRLGAQIREARLGANLTQEQVALSIGIDRPSVVEIEQGRRNMTIDTLLRITEAVGLEVRLVR
ncbi:helix-turn-helix transcriptional regulator [Streptomyces brasiliscabiei]|uniref:helix-turn-helix transcriptional regulator n=1 Tax=Streptomyces brasiliscabiei TaxID=2736302 RepID=UPI0038F6A726